MDDAVKLYRVVPLRELKRERACNLAQTLIWVSIGTLAVLVSEYYHELPVIIGIIAYSLAVGSCSRAIDTHRFIKDTHRAIKKYREAPRDPLP